MVKKILSKRLPILLSYTLFLSAFIVVGAFFVSCGRNDIEEASHEQNEYVDVEVEEYEISQAMEEEIIDDYYNSGSTDIEETPVETLQERSERIERERLEFAQSITREQILEDFDYMMAVLEENFPFFDLAYRRHGVDIREEAQLFRSVLTDVSMPIDAQIFGVQLLWEFFNSIHWVGHVRAVDDFMYRIYMFHALSNPEERWSTIRNERFTAHPSTFLFYGELDAYDMEILAPHFEGTGYNPDSYTMYVIEDGNIAHIHVEMLFSASYTDRENLREFYERIADFNHLIIDIRGNIGSGYPIFHELITAPHIHEPVYLDIASFYIGGEQNLSLLEILYDPRFGENETLVERPSHFYRKTFTVTSENIVGRDGEPIFAGTEHLVWDDFNAFDYYIVGTINSVYPSDLDDLQSRFNGQLWLLTDSLSASISENVVALYKQNDLAIIVGEQGRGIFMCRLLSSNYFALPNTGIIIRYDVGYPVCRITGRPLEEGIPPHFTNRLGMDALQTTLELIAEGAYRR